MKRELQRMTQFSGTNFFFPFLFFCFIFFLAAASKNELWRCLGSALLANLKYEIHTTAKVIMIYYSQVYLDILAIYSQ